MNRIIVGNTLLSAALAAVLLGLGCAEPEDTDSAPPSASAEDSSSKNADNETTEAEKPPEDDAEGAAEAAAESAEPDRADEEKPAADASAFKPLSEVASSDAESLEGKSAEEQLQTQLERIRELRRQTEFHQAYRLSHEAYQQFRRELGDTPAFADLRELRAQLGRERRRAGRLRTAYRDLGSDRPQRQKVAVNMLLEAGEVGTLFLRKAIREDAPPAAATAAEAILDSGRPDDKTLTTILERMLAEKDADTRDRLLMLLHRNAKLMPFEGILTAAKTAGQEDTSTALRKQIVKLLAETAGETELSDAQRRRLYDRAVSDENFSMRFAAGYLGQIFQTRAALNPAELDKLLGVDGATEMLRDYAESAKNAEDEEISAWGERFAARMEELITAGLLIMATADEPPQDAQGEKVEFKQTEGAAITEDGAAGKAYAFEGQKGDRENALYFGPVKTLDQGEAFTVAFWFFRETSRSDQTNHNVRNVMLAHSVYDDNDNLEIGSYRSEIDIYIDTSKVDSSHSLKAEVADKQWHHLALTYDGSRDPAAKLYVDGREQEGDLPWKGRLDKAGSTPLTLGNSFHHETPFKGRLDEFFLYNRALSEKEVAVLYRRAAPAQDS